VELPPQEAPLLAGLAFQNKLFASVILLPEPGVPFPKERLLEILTPMLIMVLL
jgi:hypothetical protein